MRKEKAFESIAVWSGARLWVTLHNPIYDHDSVKIVSFRLYRLTYAKLFRVTLRPLSEKHSTLLRKDTQKRIYGFLVSRIDL